MRAAALVVAVSLLALAACKREPTFDERYGAANKTIVERAKRIDAQVAGSAVPPVEEEQEGVAP